MEEIMQGAIATELLISGLALLILPTLFIVVIPLIDRILTQNVIDNINGVIDNVEYLIGSTNTTLLLATIWLILFMQFIRWIINFFTGKYWN